VGLSGSVVFCSQEEESTTETLRTLSFTEEIEKFSVGLSGSVVCCSQEEESTTETLRTLSFTEKIEEFSVGLSALSDSVVKGFPTAPPTGKLCRSQ